MFVKNNFIESVVDYFRVELLPIFSEREIRFIAKSVCSKRLTLDVHAIFPPKGVTCSESDLLFFRSVVKRLQAGEPFQYVLGSTFFYNVELEVNQHVLIPRPETEELVDWIIQSHDDSKRHVLDVGTGSGCIALALNTERPSWSIEAVDISKEALGLVKENAVKNNLKVIITQADARSREMVTESNCYDIIVSNPPYIPVKDKAEMAKHVVDFEPNLALFVLDNDPLIFYREIAFFALKKLDLNGVLYFELNEDLARETKDLLHHIGYRNVELKHDLQGKLRMLKATVN